MFKDGYFPFYDDSFFPFCCAFLEFLAAFLTAAVLVALLLGFLTEPLGLPLPFFSVLGAGVDTLVGAMFVVKDVSQDTQKKSLCCVFSWLTLPPCFTQPSNLQTQGDFLLDILQVSTKQLRRIQIKLDQYHCFIAQQLHKG